ncbi:MULTISPECIES: AzlD domain-containing protein [Salinicola]|uniref:Branched-chain amino acid ABC transporter n=1 Tax=Salinicola socius TaxID=404433 RepID=A0A1Q8SRD2_9GAMM|nr:MULTISPECIES: AzlD domain-containing protein [Salinicola]OLO03990.1 branched-chain amino acid ABC transporter [Salinicola socius]
MSLSLWIAMIIAALGTYLLRLLPLLWIQRRLTRTDDDGPVDALPKWLVILGPMMIAAVLGVSLVPRTADVPGWLATVIGLGVTLAVWRRTRSLGWPVVAGVFTFGLMVVATRMVV